MNYMANKTKAKYKRGDVVKHKTGVKVFILNPNMYSTFSVEEEEKTICGRTFWYQFWIPKKDVVVKIPVRKYTSFEFGGSYVVRFPGGNIEDVFEEELV